MNTYQLNDTSEWWDAYPWWYWNFNPADSNIHIISQTESIFKNCIEKNTLEDEINFGGIEDICLKEINANVHIDINPDIHPTDSDLINVTASEATRMIIDINKNLIAVIHYIKCNDDADKNHLLTISSCVLFSVQNITNHLNSEQVDYKLTNLLYDKTMAIIDRETWPTLKSTPYSGVKMIKNINKPRLKENIQVECSPIELN